jgi:hypothetical protein
LVCAVPFRLFCVTRGCRCLCSFRAPLLPVRFYLCFFICLPYATWALNYKPLLKKKWKLKSMQMLIYVFTKSWLQNRDRINNKSTKSDSLRCSQSRRVYQNLNSYKNLSKQHQNFRFYKFDIKSLFSIAANPAGDFSGWNPHTNGGCVASQVRCTKLPGHQCEMAFQMGYQARKQVRETALCGERLHKLIIQGCVVRRGVFDFGRFSKTEIIWPNFDGDRDSLWQNWEGVGARRTT